MSIPDPLRVVFPVGSNASTGCVSIPVTNDSELEEDERFTITITSAGTPPYAVVAVPSVASVTIVDDDQSDANTSDERKSDKDCSVFYHYPVECHPLPSRVFTLYAVECSPFTQ